MSNTLVIIPTYNEKENIAAIIKAVFSLEKTFDILVVDDNSPDGTGTIVKELQDNHNNHLSIFENQWTIKSTDMHFGPSCFVQIDSITVTY